MTRFSILAAMVLAMEISARADLVKSSVLESNVFYLRIGSVDKNLPREIQSAENALTAPIAGTVLDLRLADGDDSGAAKSIADGFVQNKSLVAILTDDETRGAAIDLAKDLRDARAGLIFGSSTNLSPDILVPVSATNEKRFLANPWGIISTNQLHLASATTNDFLPPIDHTREIDLVRARIKDGDEDDTIAKPEKPKPFIRDPVLARGLDFIKGEAIFNWGKR